MTLNHNIARLRVCYPIEVVDGENTMALDVDGDTEIVYVPPGLYRKHAEFGAEETFLDVATDAINSVSGVSITSQHLEGGRYEFGTDESGEYPAFLFDDEDWTLPVRYLGWPEDATEGVPDDDVNPSPHRAHGDWCLVDTRYADSGDYYQRSKHALLDWRAWPQRSIAVTGLERPTGFGIDPIDVMRIAAMNLPAALTKRLASWDLARVLEVYDEDGELREGDTISTLEYLWDKAPRFHQIDSDKSWVSVWLEMAGGHIVRYKACWVSDDRLDDFSLVAADTPGGAGERYDVEIHLEIFDSEIEGEE